MKHFCASDVIFSDSQPILGTRSSNGSRKFSEIKAKKKRMTSNVRNGLKWQNERESRIVHENVKK